jgi:hypothetical protein
LIPSRISFDQNRLGAGTSGITTGDATPTLPALLKREKFSDSWLAIHQLLISITQGKHELQRYLGSFTNNVPIGFIQQVYAATKTVTANANVKIDTSQYELGGASGSFDGTNGYLSTPDSADWHFGTGAFTVDFWVRFNSLPSSGAFANIIGQWATSSSYYNNVDIYNNSGTYQIRFTYYDPVNGPYVFTANVTVSTSTWYHFALVGGGTGTWYWFQNGTQIGSASNVMSGNSDNLSATLYVGAAYISGSFTRFLNGWLDEVRVSKGIARWTSNFTPPTTEYASDSYTVLLLHMDGANGSTTFIDSSGVTGPDFSISASPGSQSIGAGGSASSTLTLTALGGYSGTVDLVISSGCSAAGMSCTMNGSSTASVSGGSGTVTLVVNTLVNTPPAAYPVVVTGTDHVNNSITHQATFTVTVGTATSYLFNVKGTATQIVVTLTYSWSGSGTPPQGSVIISAPSGTVCNPSCIEAGGAVYDRTSISVSSAGNTDSIIHRVTFTINAPGVLPAWTAYVTLSGVSTYTVTIEVS